MEEKENEKVTAGTGTEQRIVIPVGRIVQIVSDKEPWTNAEGLLLGYAPDGVARVLWYKHQTMSLHWSPDQLKLKEKQNISEEITGDFRNFIESLHYKIYSGFVGV